MSGNNFMQQIFIWFLFERCYMRSRQCRSLWFPNTERLCQCIKSLRNVLWRQMVSQKRFFRSRGRQGPVLWLLGRGAQTLPKECAYTPCGASSEPPFSIVRCVKAKFGHRLPPRMDEPTSRHASVVLQAIVVFRGGRLASCSGRFQIQRVLLPRGQQGLSCRRCVHRWKCCCCFFLFFWKKLSSISSSRTATELPGPERQPSSSVDAHQKWHRPGWEGHWEPRGKSWAVRWHRRELGRQSEPENNTELNAYNKNSQNAGNLSVIPKRFEADFFHFREESRWRQK